MNNLRVFQEKDSNTLNSLENKYNFMPKDTSSNEKSLNKLCLKKTLDIAKSRKNNINTDKLEHNLKQCRDYAIKEGN